MSKSQRDHYQEFFLVAEPESDRADAQTMNLESFSTRLSYIAASVTGGKMTTEEAESRVKDLYKVWKRSNKALDKG